MGHKFSHLSTCEGVVATSTSSKGREDLFGSTMNICAKINSMAEPNGIAIGGDLYQIMKSFSFIDNNNNSYEFRELRGGYSVGLNHMYPVYIALSKNNDNTARLNINNINRLLRYNEIFKIKDIGAKQQSSQLLLQDGQQQQQGYSTTIMIVDNEPDTLFTYEWFLSDEGYNVEAFTDPQEALKPFVQFEASSYYQLVLLDIRLPILNGLQLFNTIKAISPATKIKFCSALDIAEELTSIFCLISNATISSRSQ